MRIVQVCPYDLSRPGGVQQHVISLAGELRARGHEVLVIGPGAAIAGNGQDLGIGRKRTVSFAGTSFELSLASRAELRALATRLAAWKPDVIHYHTPWVPFLPLQIFRKIRVASVATFHDTPPPGPVGFLLRQAFKLMSRVLLRHLDAAIAVSPAPLSHLRPGRSGTTPVILAPATDLSDFLKLEKPAAAEGQTILFIGRLEPRKGIAVLLDAWTLIATGRTPVPEGFKMPRLVVAGSGELAAMVIAAEARLGGAVIQHVPSPGRPQLLQLLQQATLVVSPALHGESFGIVLVEALASGTPVIAASNAGYVNVLTGPGRDLLVPPGDAGLLAEKIIALLVDTRERQKLASWGRDHARQFDVTVVAPEFDKIYRIAMARYTRSKGPGSGSQA